MKLSKTISCGGALVIALCAQAHTANAQQVDPNLPSLRAFVESVAADPTSARVIRTKPPLKTDTYVLLQDTFLGRGVGQFGKVLGNEYTVFATDLPLVGAGVTTANNKDVSAGLEGDTVGANTSNIGAPFNYAEASTDHVEYDLEALSFGSDGFIDPQTQEFVLNINGTTISRPSQHAGNQLDVDLLAETTLPMPGFIPNIWDTLASGQGSVVTDAALQVANALPVGGGSSGANLLDRFITQPFVPEPAEPGAP